MSSTHDNLSHLSNEQLLQELHELVRRDQALTAELIAHLGEVERRQLYLKQGTSSLFGYCVEVLHLPEDAAYKRIQASRAARRFPLILELVAQGSLHLTAINLLAPHLTESNHYELLAAARHQSKRRIEQLLAARFPQPDVAQVLRKLPTPTPKPASLLHELSQNLSQNSSIDASVSVPTRTPVVGEALVRAAPETTASSPMAATCDSRGADTPESPAVPSPNMTSTSAPGVRPSAVLSPLAADRYRLQLTLCDQTRNKLLWARDLMSHQNPHGDLAVVLDRALTLLVEDLEVQKFGHCKSTSRRAYDAPPSNLVAASYQPASVVAADVVAPAQVGSSQGDITAPPAPEPRATTTSDARAEAEVDPKPSRIIPRAVRRAVAARDGYQCSFVATDGRRCNARWQLQFHHRTAFAKGGATTVDNLELRCASHNRHHSVVDFGQDVIRRAREAKQRARAPQSPPTLASPRGPTAHLQDELPC